VSFAGEIGNVVTAGGSHKSGALRCVVYNPHKPQGELKYYFLPKDMWENHIVLHPTTGIGKIVYSYNSVKDEIVRFAGFQCKDFRELARAS
jgi:aspartate/tyrosine/aromatic aminotransferase